MRRFFRNISWVQIFAGALAAVTVFFFSAKIGLAGSIIGVAVASVISTFSSQLYQNVLKESSKKIKKVRTSDGSDSESDEGEDSSSSGSPRIASSADRTQRIEPEQMPASYDPRATATMVNGVVVGDDTTTIDSAVASATDTRLLSAPLPPLPSDVSHSATDAASNAQAAPSAPSASDSVSTTQHKKAILVAVISSLVAVGLSVGLILLFTGGEGTDNIVRDAVNQSQTPSQQTQDDEKPSGTTDDGTSQDSSGTSGGSSGSTTTDSGTGSGSSSGSNSSDQGSNSSNTTNGNSGSDSSGSNDSSGSSSTDSDSSTTDSSGSGSGSSSEGTGTGDSTTTDSTGKSSTGGSTSGGSSSGSSSQKSGASTSSSLK